MADNINQQLNALKTATEMGWMTKEDAKREFQRLYSLMGAGTGGGASPSASTGASPSSALQQAAASRQATTGSLKLQPAIGSNSFATAAGSSQKRKHNNPKWDAEDGAVNLVEVLLHSQGEWKGTPTVKSIRADPK